jgi:hypothetical protein
MTELAGLLFRSTSAAKEALVDAPLNRRQTARLADVPGLSW